jgi:hypothetical protein
VFRKHRVETEPDGLRNRGVREARRRFGGIDLPASLAGMLAALGTTVLLGTVTAAVEAVRHDQGARLSSLWVAGGIAGAAVLVIALLVGGWVAGRSARYDGTGNGWLSGLLFTLLVGGAGAAGNWADDRWGLLKDVQAPRWVASPSRAAEIGVALVGIAAVILAAGLGGVLGARYHRRADALIASTRDDAIMHDSNVAVVRDDATVRGEGDVDVELERSHYAGRHAVR